MTHLGLVLRSLVHRATSLGLPVIVPLAYGVAALALVAMGWGLLTAVLDKPPGKAQLLYAAGLEVVVLGQSVVAFVGLARGFRPAETATSIGYLIGILVLMPVAFLWANSERTRFSGVVLAVAAAAVAAMTFRLLVLWVPV